MKCWCSVRLGNSIRTDVGVSSMDRILSVFLLAFLSCASHAYDQPLILTPYINNGRIAEARALAANDKVIGDAPSYSGFLTVNNVSVNNLFFWYFPDSVRVNDAPLVVWLNGGPGCSSLFGALVEIGPYKLDGNWVKKNDFSWHRYMHVLFIDNPAGTGFSFTKGGDYPTNESTVGQYLLEALTQFLDLFPNLKSAPLFITGESYGGKYVPALAYAIHERNAVASKAFNLQGIAIGNGLIDPVNQLVHAQHQYQLGLIDEDEMIYLSQLSAEIVENIKQEKWREAGAGFKSLFWNYDGEPPNLLKNFTGFSSHYNILKSQDNTTAQLTKLMRRQDVKRSLHVGSLPFNNGRISEDYLFEDLMKSVLPWFVELASNYNVLLYSGQLDIILPFPTTENFLKMMVWPGAERYRRAPRKIWMVGDDIGGYSKTLYHHNGKKKLHFTNLLVRSAGHMVPVDQPRAAFEMIMRFVSLKKPF